MYVLLSLFSMIRKYYISYNILSQNFISCLHCKQINNCIKYYQLVSVSNSLANDALLTASPEKIQRKYMYILSLSICLLTKQKDTGGNS